MQAQLFSSLRARVMWLVIAGTIPLFILVLYTGLEIRSQAEEEVRRDTIHLVLSIRDEQQALVNETRLLLSVLAETPQVQARHAAACTAFLARQLSRLTRYANLGVIGSDGDIWCSALPTNDQVNVSDRSYFQRALKSREFSMGDHQLGRITDIPVMVFAYPWFGEQATSYAVLFASLPLNWIQHEIGKDALLDGAVIGIIDHPQHTLLARYPDTSIPVGASVGTSSLVEVMHANNGTGAAEVRGLDDIKRFYAFTRLDSLPDEKEIYVVYGIPSSAVYAEADMLMARNLAALGLVTLLALLAAWHGCNVLVLRPVHELLGVTRQLAAGNLQARVTTPDSSNEISELGREFNFMAEVLDKRDQDALQAERLQRTSEMKLRQVIETVPDIIYISDINKTFDATFVSPALTRILGYTPEEMVNTPAGWANAIHPDDREQALTQLRNAVDNAEANFSVEYRMGHKDGKSFRWFEGRGHIDRDAAGHALAIYGVMTDITEKKHAESISARLGRILENSWNEIYVFDADTLRFIDASKGACTNLGYTMDELRQLTPLNLKPDITLKQLEALLGPLRRGEKTQLSFQSNHQRKDGSTYPVEVRYQYSKTEQQPAFIATIQDISERVRYITELEHHALYDSLTGLPNHSLFHDRVEHAIRLAHHNHNPLAIISMDVANLREVNDTMGYSAGDAVLQEVGSRLKSTLFEADTVARLNGDVFAIALANVDQARVPLVVRKIQKLFEQPVIVQGTPLEIETAIGIALCPEHSDDPAMLLLYADIAMQVAKSEAAGFNIYHPADNPFSLRRLKLLGELRQAIEQKTLVIYYQPKIDLITGNVTSVEALARWPHPVEGMIPPGDFIPMIEQSGLIRPFTLWVLEETIKQIADWTLAGIQLGIAVNLSTRNLLDPDLPGNIIQLLQHHDVLPGRLTLEVTESAIMTRPETALKSLTQLHEAGLKLSIDDFGTGYSSLAYLKKMPVDELKIDKGFVSALATNEDDAVIVHSTIELARNMGLKTVAEGVEDQEVLDVLRILKCDVAQGYHMSKPVPVRELEIWLENSPWGLQRTTPDEA